MGAVLLADDPALGRRVAVKVMLAHRAADPAARDRFLREARAAAAVRHDHVVPIFHVGESDGTPFLVMPLLEGESLEARLRRGPLSPDEVARVGREAALGLSAAHAKGLVHRDVKPANLWLEAPNGRVLVLDFGLARSADASDGVTRAGSVLGTAAYMAPEQADGLPVDARADLFSLGATLYQAATGACPFQRPTLTAMLRAVCDHQPPPPHEVNPAVPAALSDLVMRLLAKRPADRPPSAAAVAEVLPAVASGVSGQAATAEFVPGGGRKRRSRAVVWAALAALVLVGGAVWFATRTPDARPVTPSDGASPPGPVTPPVTPVARASHKVRVDVLVERDKKLLRLDRPGALPLKADDGFAVEATCDPPAFLYLVWVDPNHDVTPVYPWNPAVGWGSRPAKEEPRAKVRLPERGEVYHAPQAKPGVATIVALTRPTPLDVPDEVVRPWFETLPELALDPADEGAAVWFAEYQQSDAPEYRRTFGTKAQGDPFADWQGRLFRAVGDRATGQSAVSFARTGRK
jgi:hypothetical protein